MGEVGRWIEAGCRPSCSCLCVCLCVCVGFGGMQVQHCGLPSSEQASGSGLACSALSPGIDPRSAVRRSRPTRRRGLLQGMKLAISVPIHYHQSRVVAFAALRAHPWTHCQVARASSHRTPPPHSSWRLREAVSPTQSKSNDWVNAKRGHDVSEMPVLTMDIGEVIYYSGATA